MGSSVAEDYYVVVETGGGEKAVFDRSAAKTLGLVAEVGDTVVPLGRQVLAVYFPSSGRLLLPPEEGTWAAGRPFETRIGRIASTHIYPYGFFLSPPSFIILGSGAEPRRVADAVEALARVLDAMEVSSKASSVFDVLAYEEEGGDNGRVPPDDEELREKLLGLQLQLIDLMRVARGRESKRVKYRVVEGGRVLAEGELGAGEAGVVVVRWPGNALTAIAVVGAPGVEDRVGELRLVNLAAHPLKIMSIEQDKGEEEALAYAAEPLAAVLWALAGRSDALLRALTLTHTETTPA